MHGRVARAGRPLHDRRRGRRAAVELIDPAAPRRSRRSGGRRPRAAAPRPRRSGPGRPGRGARHRRLGLARSGPRARHFALCGGSAGCARGRSRCACGEQPCRRGAVRSCSRSRTRSRRRHSGCSYRGGSPSWCRRATPRRGMATRSSRSRHLRTGRSSPSERRDFDFSRRYSAADDPGRGRIPARRGSVDPDVAAADLLRPDHLPALADAAVHAARQAEQAGGELGLDGHVERRRRARGGESRAAGGRGLPAQPAALRAPRGARAEGDPPLRPAGHRQDAAREGGRERVGRELLLAERLGLRRDVRRPRRLAHPQALRRGAQARPLDRVHRRARRRRHRRARAPASTASTTRR